MTSETKEKEEQGSPEPTPSYIGLLIAFLIFPVGIAYVAGLISVPSVLHVFNRPSTSQCTEPNHVVLSFNDGPSEYNARIRRRLEKMGARTTFFVNGNVDSCIYSEPSVEALRESFKAGHQIASHTWSRLDLTKLDDATIRWELLRLETAFRKILGVRPRYMRPPYGKVNALVTQVLKDMDYQLVLYDLDIEDESAHKAGINNVDYGKRLIDTAVAKNHSSLVVLMHEKYSDTVLQVFPHALKQFSDAGYKVSTAGACMGLPDWADWYDVVGEPEERDMTWQC